MPAASCDHPPGLGRSQTHTVCTPCARRIHGPRTQDSRVKELYSCLNFKRRNFCPASLPVGCIFAKRRGVALLFPPDFGKAPSFCELGGATELPHVGGPFTGETKRGHRHSKWGASAGHIYIHTYRPYSILQQLCESESLPEWVMIGRIFTRLLRSIPERSIMTHPSCRPLLERTRGTKENLCAP